MSNIATNISERAVPSGSIRSAIALLNSNSPTLLSVQKWMLMARVQRAAKLGDANAQRFVMLSELNTEMATTH
jgi:hypothetical protein